MYAFMNGTNTKKFAKQSYRKLLKQATELGLPFNDDIFPSIDSSIGPSLSFRKNLNVGKIVWKRPNELSTEPHFLYNEKLGHSTNIQFFGDGNQWLIAAALTVAQDKSLIYKVVPKEQNNFSHGIFKIYIWDHGSWTKILVDDKLPSYDNKLVFTRSWDDIYWLPILEKAYAKFKGSYEKLYSGNLRDALCDLTGMPSENIIIERHDDKNDYFRLISEELSSKSFICIKTRDDIDEGSCLKPNRIYIINQVKKPSSGTFKKSLKETNPSIKLVDTIYPDTKKSKSTFLSDKYLEQWLSIENLVNYFESLTICRVNIESNKCVLAKRALGSSQFCFDIHCATDDIMIDIMQTEEEKLGFKIYEVEFNRKFKVHNFSLVNLKYVFDPVKSRSIFKQIRLSYGRYILRPNCDQSLSLLIRLYSSKNSDLRELDKDGPEKKFLSFFSSNKQLYVSKLIVKSITGIEKQDRFGTANPYLVVRCGNHAVKSAPVNDTLNPDFRDFSAIFYHEKQATIMIEVWHNSLIFDSFIGQVKVTPEITSNPDTYKENELCGRKKDHKRPGILKYKLHTSEDLKLF